MYLKPILVSLGLAVVFVLGVYLYGVFTFNDSDVSITPSNSRGIVTGSESTEDDSIVTETNQPVPSIVSDSVTITVPVIKEKDSNDGNSESLSQPLPETSEVQVSKSEISDFLAKLIERDNLASNRLVESFKLRPKREDYDNAFDYYDALVEYFDSTQHLLDDAIDSGLAVLRGLSPLELAKVIADAKENLVNHPELDITPEQLDEFAKEFLQ